LGFAYSLKIYLMIPFREMKEYRQGAAGETAIARWIRSRGAYVLPVYEKIIEEGKGPQLFGPAGSLIAPDLMVIKSTGFYWVEAKHKSGFSWNRQRGIFVTGIDLKHYENYLKVAEVLNRPVWLLFLQAGMPTKDCPYTETPKGLYGEEISKLRQKESHRSDKYGPSGMVYWDIKSLRFIAEYEDVLR
jgi:hypothetical protein